MPNLPIPHSESIYENVAPPMRGPNCTRPAPRIGRWVFPPGPAPFVGSLADGTGGPVVLKDAMARDVVVPPAAPRYKPARSPLSIGLIAPPWSELPTARLGTPFPEVVHALTAYEWMDQLGDVDVVHDHTLCGPLLLRGSRI